MNPFYRTHEEVNVLHNQARASLPRTLADGKRLARNEQLGLPSASVRGLVLVRRIARKKQQGFAGLKSHAPHLLATAA